MKKRTPALFERIEKYLNDSLTPSEKLSFEEQLKSDPALKEELEKHRQLHSALQDFEAIDFRKKVQHISEISNESARVSLNSRRKIWIAVAAGIAALVVLSLFWNTISRASDGKLFQEYYQPYPITDVVRGDASELLVTVRKAYSEKKYRDVIPDLVVLVEQQPPNLDLQLALGCSYLETQQYEKAISVFKESKEQNGYSESAQWYLALTYLKTENYEQVKTELLEIIAYEGIYKEQAQQLYDELNLNNSE